MQLVSKRLASKMTKGTLRTVETTREEGPCRDEELQIWGERERERQRKQNEEGDNAACGEKKLSETQAQQAPQVHKPHALAQIRPPCASSSAGIEAEFRTIASADVICIRRK